MYADLQGWCRWLTRRTEVWQAVRAGWACWRWTNQSRRHLLAAVDWICRVSTLSCRGSAPAAPSSQRRPGRRRWKEPRRESAKRRERSPSSPGRLSSAGFRSSYWPWCGRSAPNDATILRCWSAWSAGSATSTVCWIPSFTLCSTRTFAWPSARSCSANIAIAVTNISSPRHSRATRRDSLKYDDWCDGPLGEQTWSEVSRKSGLKQNQKVMLDSLWANNSFVR